MNRQVTQFAVATVGMAGLVAATLATIITEAEKELTYMLVVGLVSVTSTSAAWLFRLNGTK